MKKVLLLCASIAMSICVMGQSTGSRPNNAPKASIPASLKRTDIKVPYRRDRIDNGEVQAMQNTGPLRQNPSMLNVMTDVTTIVGNTKYDLQTNNAVSNRIVVNNDNSISVAWTYSPDANTSATPPYPYRGTGYNYYDATTQIWTYAYPTVPGARTEGASNRTGFTNIVVTPAGVEMTIAHQAVTGTTFNRLVLNKRLTKGGTPAANPWTLTQPWGSTGFDTWAKAVGGLTNENVYAIWNGSGAAATTTSPPNIVCGQNGPLLFSMSQDAGDNWTTASCIPEIDSNFYCGFGGDCYGLDAKGDSVAIVVGDTYTDLVLLKSSDRGQTWTKTIVRKHPIAKYGCTDRATFYMNDDAVVDTIHSHGGDARVVIDNNGMAHVVYSRFDYHDADSTDEFYNPHYGTDELIYWNESMGADTTTQWDTLTYGHTPGVTIAEAEDFNQNGQIDVPADTFTNCTNNLPWGNYQTGITGMPSLGIDDWGNIYISYQTINELADTTTWHMSHRHIYMKAIPYDAVLGYDPANATTAWNIIESINQGGDGENEECVFGTIARKVDLNTKTAYVLYQADQIPGHSLATAGTCEQTLNTNNINSIRIAKVDITNLGIGVDELSQNDLQVLQNYPNPAHDITNITATAKKAADLKIVIADILGKVVYTDSKGKVAAGNHTFTVNTSSFAKGVYTYTVQLGDTKTTRKMIVE